MKKIFLCFLSLIFAFSLCGCKKKDNLADLSVGLTNYSIDIKLNVQEKSAKVLQVVDYVNNTDAILKTIKFHLYPQYFEQGATDHVVSSTKLNQAYPNGMSYANFEIDRVVVQNEDKPVVYSGEHESILDVTLNLSLIPQDRVEIMIEYHFTLPNCEHRFGYGDNTINLANFYPILCVYENGSFNEAGYNPNGDPFYSEMANYSVNITVPNQYVVASTGDKMSENSIGENKVVSYKANLVRDFALVVSDKFEIKSEQVADTTIIYYCYDDPHSNQSLKAGVDAIKTFSNLFGSFPYKTFSIVKTDFVHGGMEYPNLIMISDQIDTLDDYLNVIVHETAHQWWYAMVGNDEIKYPWLDEALTEYSSILFYDYNEGYNFTHGQMVNACKENYTLFVSIYNDVLGNIDTSMRASDQYSTEPEYTYCTYVKGVLMYDSLYNLVGEKKFVQSLKKYFENNKFKNTTPENLIMAFEEINDGDYHNFFSSWIDGKVVIR
ncbi:MAG: M1 family metallopeptidase [Clostridia bacterium]|nr:M1 family metallopeptidase [Clostridia bacterium]